MRRGLLLHVMALGLAILGAGHALSRVALPGDTVGGQQQALRTALSQARDARLRSEKLETQARRLGQSADRARRDALALAARIQESEAEISAAEARIALIAGQQRRQRARLAQQQRPIVRLNAALQSLARRPTALALVQPGSIKDVVHVRAVMASVMPVVESRTRGLRAEVARGRELRAQADQAADLLRDGQGTLTTRRARLARVETEMRIAARARAGRAGFEQDRAVALSEEARDIGELVDLIRVNGSVRDQLAALDGPVMRPARPEESRVVTDGRAERSADARPAYRLPVIGQIVTGLGEVSESGVRARGLTIATRAGAQVVAPADGRIAFAGPYRSYGRIVIIEHSGGWTTLVTTLATTSVAVGDEVLQGQPIGAAADRRPTVTVELRRAGRPIDILALIGAA